MIGRSVQQRLTTILQLFALIIIVSFATSALLLTGRALRIDETELLKSTAQRVAENLDHELAEEGTLERASASILAEEPSSPVLILVRAPDGRLLGSTAAGTIGGKQLAVEKPAGTATPSRHSEFASARCGAIVEASLVPKPRQDVVARLVRILLFIAVPLTLLALLLARWTIARALRPLSEMAHQASAASPESGRHLLTEGYGLREVDELAHAFNRLLQSLDEHLESEQRFTAEASHELRTPLTVLSGEIEMALTVPDVPPVARECLVRAAEETDQMRQLAEALLLLRRSGGELNDPQLGFESVNLGDILRDARDALLVRFPDRARDLTYALPDELVIRGQPALMASAIGNLLDNAFKFTRPGDPIHIELGTVAGRVRLTVEDGGTGIPPEDAQQLFEPFYRGRRARGGTPGFGLGLPILRRVVLAHGGDVRLCASRFGGAGFELSLPKWTPRTESGPWLNEDSSSLS